MKIYIKIEKTIIKFDKIKIPKQISHKPISMKNVDNNKIVVSNKAPFVKKGFNTLLATKVLKN